MPDRDHQRLRDLFARGLELPLGARDAFLVTACDGDDALRQRVLAMLAGAEDARFLSAPNGRMPVGERRRSR